MSLLICIRYNKVFDVAINSVTEVKSDFSWYEQNVVVDAPAEKVCSAYSLPSNVLSLSIISKTLIESLWPQKSLHQPHATVGVANLCIIGCIRP